MQGGDRVETVTVWKELADLEPESALRTTYAGLALVFADLAGCVPVWKQELEGWNMRKSQIVEEWREEGRIEGRQEGRIEAYQGILLRMLQKRFSGVSSPEVTTAVQAQTNAEELMRWLELLDNAASLEAFRAAINA
jgi:hypothetical protein